jgi:Xaa-Pro aminopeptidase
MNDPAADSAGQDARRVNAVSAPEMARRWRAVRERMRAAGVDALVLQSSSDWVGGYLRWLCNEPATNGYAASVVFPLEGGMSVVEQGPFDALRSFDAAAVAVHGVARRLGVPAYASIGYTGDYDAQLVLAECARLGVRSVGLVAPAAMYYSFGHSLQQGLQQRGVQIIDFTDPVDRIKAIKSVEEQGLIRKVAAMQDAVLLRLREFIRPGRRDFEIAAHAQYLGQQLGSEQGIFLGSSASAGCCAAFLPRFLQGRTLRRGDVYSQLIENNGAGGYYTELSRIFVLGRASQELRELHERVLEAQRFALSLLRPGASCADIHQQHNAWMREHGLPEERRLSIHGMGYDMVERPLIRHDEDMRIEPGMAIVVHPGVLNERLFVHNTDVYLIGPQGPEACLHATPKEIFEIDVGA